MEERIVMAPAICNGRPSIRGTWIRRVVLEQALIQFALLDRIDDGHDDIVFFADEGGAWQVGVDWPRVLPTWFKLLAATVEPADYAQRITTLLSNHHRSGRDEMLAVAHRIASKDQRAALREAIGS